MPHATASTTSLLQRSRLEDSEPASHFLRGNSVKAVYSSHVALQVFVCKLQGETKQKHHRLIAVVALADRTPPATQPTGLDRSTGARTGIVLLTKITVRQARAFARIFLFAPLRFDQARADVGDQVQS